MIDEATDLTFDRCTGEAQRNFDLWLYTQARIDRKWEQIRALRAGKPVPEDLPFRPASEFKGEK